MNYITIEVNKKFLLLAGLLLAFVISVVGAYKVGYRRGAEAAMDYVINYLQGKQDGIDKSM